MKKHIFNPLLVAKQPIFKAFCDFGGAKMACNGSKWAHFTCSGTPNGLGSFLKKYIFDPVWTHFLSQNSPFSRHFGISRRPKRATTSSKRAKNTCLGIPCGPGSFFTKSIFFCTRWTMDLVDPVWNPRFWATSRSLPQPTRPRYGGVGVAQGNFWGWKPTKVGGCRWIRCARNRVWSHVAQDMVCSPS